MPVSTAGSRVSGTLNPYIDGNDNQHKQSTSSNDGEDSNNMARNQKMIRTISAEHAFNDTKTVRQNMRYMQLETQYRGI
ncbi:hypothetical protein [Dickeya dadantii]|uniref:hypothetical protein n=1 Tax=Dickeya dadantii TaxID=204038 RepID=UPI0003A7005D|nr:hypothetical protein [Dickeya dadantii]